MADVAHDAPASPKPGDIAPQQASRPDSPDRGKLRVFISYSRDDLDFADQLNAALDLCGFGCFIDRQGISGGEDWKRRLGNLISEADTVVFVLSPTSARSEICDWEVEEATRLGKRILSVICRPLEGASPPARLRERNYIFFYDDPKAAPGSGFGTGLAKLVAALNTDFDWLREWDKGGRPANRLLSGDDISDAKTWVARRPKSAPDPTALHLDFIRASEEEAEARSNAQRKQLEEMAAAQAEREAALHQAEETQRKRATMARIRNIALVAVSILALLAVWLGWRAEQQRKVAEEQKKQADVILAGVSNITTKLHAQMDDDTKKKVFAVFQTGAHHDHATSMGYLGLFYSEAFGVAQDYAKAREWYEKAAAKDNANAMYELGQIYSEGFGVPQDYAKAREWFEKAASGTSQFRIAEAGAMWNLGFLYANGLSVPQDYAKAREWYEKAADNGDADAMNSLGVLYHNGLGVPQDYAKAHEWYEKAADNGDADAMNSLGMLYHNGLGVPQDYAKAHEWYEKAADKGDASAMLNLGLLYESGQGVDQDHAKAREWFEKAADRGDASTMEIDMAQAFSGAALVARKFTKALTFADRAHALLPDDLTIESYRALALMFLGRGEESKALYLAYKGKSVLERDGKLWEHVIAEDFAEFRKAGLTHPMMADIEKELGVSR
jgi:TPR repeat protein